MGSRLREKKYQGLLLARHRETGWTFRFSVETNRQFCRSFVGEVQLRRNYLISLSNEAFHTFGGFILVEQSGANLLQTNNDLLSAKVLSILLVFLNFKREARKFSPVCEKLEDRPATAERGKMNPFGGFRSTEISPVTAGECLNKRR